MEDIDGVEVLQSTAYVCSQLSYLLVRESLLLHMDQLEREEGGRERGKEVD